MSFRLIVFKVVDGTGSYKSQVFRFAVVASSNAAEAGTCRTFALSKSYGFGPWKDLTASSWNTLLSIYLPYVVIDGWYKVECDGYANAQNNRKFMIDITVDGFTEDTSIQDYFK